MDSSNFRLVAGATASLAIVIPLIYYWLLPKPIPGIPHNPVTGVLGDIPEVAATLKDNERSIVDFFHIQVKKHGPISQLFFGNRLKVLLADRGEIDRLVAHGKSTDLSVDNRTVLACLAPTGMNSLPANSTWKRHRRIAGPSMHRRYLSRMAVHISTGANGLINLWKKKTQLANGQAFETAFDIQSAAADSMASIAIGASLRSTEKAAASLSLLGSSSPGVVEFSLGEISPLFAAVREVATKVNIGFNLPYSGVILPLILWFSSSWRTHYKVLQDYVSKSVTDARKRQDVTSDSKGNLTTDADCMVDMFLQQESREDTVGFDSQEILDEILIMFVGGQETTANTLSWFVKYMPTDPEIQRRLHKEVTEVFGSDSDSLVSLEQFDSVEQLPVLEAVLTETLRCACVAAAIGRSLTADEVILGHRVPKGTEIIVALACLGMSESEWGPDAGTWRPSRWLNSDGSFNRDAGPSGDPFGLGHRVCFGQRLGVLQLKVFMVAMSRAFFFKPVPAEFDSTKAIDLITRRPKMCYCALEEWDA